MRTKNKRIRPGALLRTKHKLYFTDLKHKPSTTTINKNTILMLVQEEKKDDTNEHHQIFLDLDGNFIHSFSVFSVEDKIKSGWLKSI